MRPGLAPWSASPLVRLVLSGKPAQNGSGIGKSQKIALCTLSLSMGNIEPRDDPYELVGIGEDYDNSSEKWLNWGLL